MFCNFQVPGVPPRKIGDGAKTLKNEIFPTISRIWVAEAWICISWNAHEPHTDKKKREGQNEWGNKAAFLGKCMKI